MARPDLSGTWRLNRQKSRLEIPMPDSTVFVIVHREPQFHLERTHIVGETRDLFSIDLTTDGQVVHAVHRGISIASRAFWDRDVLVFDSEMTMGDERGTNVVRYELGEGRDTFVACESVDFAGHAHTNRWVFERQERPNG
jgi:hypothetical protein